MQDPVVPPGQSASTTQAVVVAALHVPLVSPAHEPVPAPGHVASALQLAAAGPLKTPRGGFGDAQTDAT